MPQTAWRHWLLIVNAAVGLFLAGAFAAPICAALGWATLADGIYAAYRYACHEWAFRSFFLFAPNQPPLAIYDQSQLAALHLDAFAFSGSADLGWKMAFCERDLAIYVGLLVVGLVYARRRALRPASFRVYALLILPMALDGFTQLFGWRESTWQLRVATGLLFGLGSGWLVLPRLEASFSLQPARRRYAADTQCNPAPAAALVAAAAAAPPPPPRPALRAPATEPEPQLSPPG